MEIRDLMYPPILVTQHTSVLQAARLMEEGGTGAVLVHQQEGSYGIATERDILYKVVADERNPIKTKVREIMSLDVHTIEAHRDIRRAYQLFTLHNIRRLSVVDKGVIVGIIDSRTTARYSIFIYDEYMRMISETNEKYVRALKQNVKNIMREAILVSPDTSILDASILMRGKEAGEVLVKVNKGRYGIATERDILVKVVSKALEPADIMVGEVYTPLHTFIDVGKSIRDASMLFNVRNIRRLPVMDGNEIIGIITEKDISKFCVFAFTIALQALSEIEK
jgi:CBS domain-containing protein